MALDIRRALAANWPMKLTSLAVAAVLWAVFTAQEPRTQFVPVTLNIELPEGRRLTEDPPEVRALFSGPARELFKLYSSPPFVDLQVPDIPTTTYRIDLSLQDLQYSSDVAVAAQDLRPRQIEFLLDSVSSRTVPVFADLRVTPDTGYQVVGDITWMPQTIVVTGPDIELQRLTSLRTVVREITDARETIRERLPIDTTGLSAVRLSQSGVDVVALVSEVSTRVLQNVRIALVGGTQTDWLVDPATVLVSLSGPIIRLNTLTADSVRVTARVNPDADSVLVAVSVQAPPGMQATTTPERVTLRRRRGG